MFKAGGTAVIAGVGSLVINPDGSYTFTPEADFNGKMPQAGYTVTDGDLTASSTLDVTITAANDAPVANPDVMVTPEDVPVSGNVLGNDTDVDGDTLTVTGYQIDTDGDGTPESFQPGETATITGVGTLVINEDGSYTFTPELNYNGQVPEAAYSITDGTATAASTLNILVDTGTNDAPVAQPDVAVTPEGVAVSGDLLANDSDPDGNPLVVTEYEVDTDGDGTPEIFKAGETATIAGVGALTVNADGSYTFTPLPDFLGKVPEVGYTVSDGKLTDASTLNITVDSANDAPLAQPDTATGPEDSPVTGNVLANDTDPEGNPLVVASFSIDTDGDGIPEVFKAGGTAVIAGVGSLVINPDGSYTFTPEADFNGKMPQAGYTVTDGDLTASSTLDVTITAANDAPVANPDVMVTPEDVPVSGNVLGNDTDVDGDTLTVTGYQIDTDGDGTPESFQPGETATITGVGTLVINEDGSYTFTPELNYNGRCRRRPTASLTARRRRRVR